MKIIYAMVTEVFLLISIGMPCVYLMWRLGEKKMTLKEYVGKYGQTIAYFAVILLGLLFAFIYNVFIIKK
jgi:hypothetical protein